MEITETLQSIASGATSRYDLWTKVCNTLQFPHIAEIGVFEGHFSETLLRNCPSITRYTMVDPWRHLEDWDKPSNKSDERHTIRYEEMLNCTDFAKDKRVILRGTTAEVIDEIEDESIDFMYIDGDHTLRGITIDLQLLWPKLKVGGWIGCDDFCSDIWQHSLEYEPTFIFPYVEYFAEATGSSLFGLPYNQCLFQKNPKGSTYHMHDFVGAYSDATVRNQLLRFRFPTWKIDNAYNKLKEIKRSFLK